MAILDCLLFKPDHKAHTNPCDYKVVPQEIFIQSGSESLCAWHFRSKNPRAILVQFHGNAENLTSHAPYVGWMAEHDIEVLAFDYAGYGQSSGKPSVRQALGDCHSVYEFTKKVATEKNIPLVTLGQSIGSQFLIPTLAALPTQRLPKLVILEGSFPSARKLSVKILQNSIPIKWVSALLSKLVSEQVKAEDHIASVETRFLFIHSEEDQIVPVDLGMELYGLVPESRATTWKLAQGLHLKGFTSEFPENRSRLIEFFKAEL